MIRVRRSSTSTLAAVAATAAAVAATALVPASAGAVPKLATYRASVVVQGGMTTKLRHDTLATCAPGQAWLSTNTVDMDVRATVTVRAVGDVVGARARRAKGIEHAGVISDYQESNACAPAAPVRLTRPSCRTFTLPTMPMGLGSQGRSAQVAFGRTGGPSQARGACDVPRITTTAGSADLSLLEHPGSGLVLPFDVSRSSFRTLGRGKKLIRRLRVTGECGAARVRTGSAVSSLGPLDHGDCTVDGTFNVEITRLR
ncbi:hypothetical protein [Patulibacter minatonensis]|uniref:hypothetical protein n=1 Tax=Patulibacter minatonensis TaxID=298163 RepID=UPI00047E6E21|nr:hypothetical protein [Patulibacter minatonensis]